MKNIFAILAILLLSGCGWKDRAEAYLTGYASQCIGGVLYYQFASGVTVAYNADGTVRMCK